MNERIKELAEQNGFIHKWQPPGEQYEKLQTLEKFAKLIVRDCRDMFVVNSPSWNLLNEKLEHFGVSQ